MFDIVLKRVMAISLGLGMGAFYFKAIFIEQKIHANNEEIH